MRTADRTCARCGRMISIGEDYLQSSVTGDSCYCSEDCLKRDILDSHVDEVVADYIGDKAEWYTHEEDDPYDRYGVSRSDF